MDRYIISWSNKSTVADKKKNSRTRSENDRTVPYSTSVVCRTRAYTVPYVRTTYGVLALVRTYVRIRVASLVRVRVVHVAAGAELPN